VQLTITQAAELLQTTESQVRRWIRDRGLPAVRLHEQYRLNQVDLLDWANSHQIPVSPAVANEAPPALLAAALQRGGIHRDVPGDSCEAVLRACVDRLALPAGVDRELVLAMLAARQAQGTTAVGGGIALPHARFPLVAAVAEPFVALALLAQPVPFAAPDGQPVTALFVLLTPTPRVHLALLAALARALEGPLRTAVQQRAIDEALFRAAGGRGGA
jgi:PTS system nitrogen regulatory IIA component